MLVILEGPDATGKTTLAESISRAYNCEIRKCGPPLTERPFYEYQTQLHACARARVVYDRFFHGESVYGPIFREHGLTPVEQFYLELEATWLNAVVIWCTAPRQVVVDRIEARENQSFFDKQLLMRFDEVNAGYKRVIAACRMKQLHYDSSKVRPQDVIDTLAMLDSTQPAIEFRYGIGNWRARTAIVGDRFSRYQVMPRGGSREWLNPPCCHYRPFIKTASSNYLWKAILDTQIQADDIYVTNSVKDQLAPSASLNVLERELTGFSNVVALGQHASSRLADIEIEHRTLKHPQFWKRFHFHERARYAALLKEAVLES